MDNFCLIYSILSPYSVFDHLEGYLNRYLSGFPSIGASVLLSRVFFFNQ